MDQDVNQESEKQIEKNVEQLLPQQKKPGKVALQVFAVVVLLSLVGAGVYAWQNNRVAQLQNQVTELKRETVTQLQPEELTTKIKAELAKDYTVLDLNNNNKPSASEISIRTDETSPAYRPKGYNFYTNYAGGSTITVLTHDADPSGDPLPKAIDKTIRTNVAQVYTAAGLAKKSTRGRASDGNGLDIYEGKGLICTVDTTEAEISGSTASCGLLSEYSSAGAKTKPFAEALGDVEITAILSNLTITASVVKGYERAELGVGDINLGGGAVALFYKKEGGSWTYFKTVQEALACSEYNTEDLRNAYKGEKCYDAKTNSSDAIIK